MVLAIRLMEKHGLTIDEADVLTGVLTGRSKSATFRGWPSPPPGDWSRFPIAAGRH